MTALLFPWTLALVACAGDSIVAEDGRDGGASPGPLGSSSPLDGEALADVYEAALGESPLLAAAGVTDASQGLEAEASGCQAGPNFGGWVRDNVGGCEGRWDFTCTGQSYEVDCNCPAGSCVCFAATTHVVGFDCSAVSTSSCNPAMSPSGTQVSSLCGFPVPTTVLGN